jgi:hypothetical protein
MEPFRITSSNLYFLADQVPVSIIPDVSYLLDGTPIAGCTVPVSGDTDALNNTRALRP